MRRALLPILLLGMFLFSPLRSLRVTAGFLIAVLGVSAIAHYVLPRMIGVAGRSAWCG